MPPPANLFKGKKGYKAMQHRQAIYVLSHEDYLRIEQMLVALKIALEAVFDRRQVDSSACPDDVDDFDDMAATLNRDYRF